MIEGRKMKITFNDITEDKMDELEEIFINMLGVYTEIYNGTCEDVFKYVLDIQEDNFIIDDLDYDLEHVSVLFKNDSYMVEVMTNDTVATVEIGRDEVVSININ